MNFDTYLANIPNLHSWDGGTTWGTGGFNRVQLERIFEFIRGNAPQHPNIIETGAGNSTICFLLTSPGRLVSIAPDQGLFDRISLYCQQNHIDTRALESYPDRSEWVLPALARESDARFDFALLDGSHNWPMVMLDFFYMNFVVRRGGFIMLDDINLHSVKELARLLAYDRAHYRLSANLGKALIFEKTTEQRVMGEWDSQPYITAMTDAHRHHPSGLGLWRVKPMVWISRSLLPLRALWHTARKLKEQVVGVRSTHSTHARWYSFRIGRSSRGRAQRKTYSGGLSGRHRH